MSSPPILEQFLGRVRREVRARRAERGAWRGAFWGLLAATLLLAFKGSLEDERLAALFAIAAVLAAITGWAMTAYARRIGELDAARLADRAFGLQDRLATALECMAQPARPALTEALIGETAAKVEALDHRPVMRRTYPWEARFAALPLASAIALAVAPAFPDPHAWLKEHLRLDPAAARSAVPAQDRAAAFGTQLQQREQQAAQDALRRAAAGEQPREGEAGAFKDRALKQQQSDFASFVKKGDDRLRMLEHSDRLPDLQSDFASSQYRLLMRKTRELGAGKGPQQLSTAKLGQILREMERLGRKGGEWSEDTMEGLEALDEGNTEGAMESLQSALGKLRDSEERQRSSRNLRGGRDLKPDDADDGRGEAGSNMNDVDRRGYSLAKSKGSTASGKGTPRLRSTPYDAGIEGSRNGRAPMYDTQMTSRPGGGPRNLQYLSEFGQYRRLMEDAITREQVPRDYHDQIRDYFKSLNEQ